MLMPLIIKAVGKIAAEKLTEKVFNDGVDDKKKKKKTAYGKKTSKKTTRKNKSAKKRKPIKNKK